MIEVKEGDIFINEDGEELRVERVLEVNDEDNTSVVLAEDGLKYEVALNGEQLEGELYDEEDEDFEDDDFEDLGGGEVADEDEEE
jgi:hypothetical protein